MGITCVNCCIKMKLLLIFSLSLALASSISIKNRIAEDYLRAQTDEEYDYDGDYYDDELLTEMRADTNEYDEDYYDYDGFLTQLRNADEEYEYDEEYNDDMMTDYFETESGFGSTDFIGSESEGRMSSGSESHHFGSGSEYEYTFGSEED